MPLIYDPEGTNPDNLVTETHKVFSNTTGNMLKRRIVPLQGPMFKDSVKVFLESDTNRDNPLSPFFHFSYSPVHSSLSLVLNQEVMSWIVLNYTPAEENVIVEYQSVGGDNIDNELFEQWEYAILNTDMNPLDAFDILKIKGQGGNYIPMTEFIQERKENTLLGQLGSSVRSIADAIKDRNIPQDDPILTSIVSNIGTMSNSLTTLQQQLAANNNTLTNRLDNLDLDIFNIETVSNPAVIFHVRGYSYKNAMNKNNNEVGATVNEDGLSSVINPLRFHKGSVLKGIRLLAYSASVNAEIPSETNVTIRVGLWENTGSGMTLVNNYDLAVINKDQVTGRNDLPVDPDPIKAELLELNFPLDENKAYGLTFEAKDDYGVTTPINNSRVTGLDGYHIDLLTVI